MSRLTSPTVIGLPFNPWAARRTASSDAIRRRTGA
jgi:hypothetical protein